MRTLQISALIVLASLSILSCNRDTPEPGPTTPLRTFTPGEGMFVLNEGGFNAGNASLSYYATGGADAGASFNDLFYKSNGVPLGDVAQSMAFINGELYIIVNNSSKIVVVNPSDLKVLHTITGLNGPRNIVQVGGRAYVTQMNSTKVMILDLASHSIAGSIDFRTTTEAISCVNNKLFVTSQVSDKLFVVDLSVGNTVDSTAVIAPGGNSMVTDVNGKLWILTYGSWSAASAGGLFRIDPATNLLEASMPFSTSDFPTHLCKNPAGDSLFFLNYSVYRMAITDPALPTASFISGASHSFYTLGLMPTTNDLYIGDAVDYVQSGIIYRYNSSGTVLDTDTVGVNPNGFLLY